MKEIQLSIQSRIAKEQGEAVPPPFETNFIIGLASDGMCPFEYHLLGKKEGEQIFFQLNRAEISDTFGHINVPMELFPGHADDFCVTVDILAISDVSQREIVRSMAEITTHGGHCCDHCAC